MRDFNQSSECVLRSVSLTFKLKIYFQTKTVIFSRHDAKLPLHNIHFEVT